MRIDRDLTEIACLVGGELSRDVSFKIGQIASLEAATSFDMAVIYERGDTSVFSEVDRKKISECQAGVILAQKPIVPGKCYLLVEDPLHALQQIIKLHEQRHKRAGDATAISPLAVIEEGVILADNVTIEPYAIIKSGAVIGAYATIGAQSYIGYDAIIGDSVRIASGVTVEQGCEIGTHSIIQAGVVIGSDGFGYQVTARGMRRIPHIGSVVVGKHVEIGANATIDRATFDRTIIGDGAKIDNLVHIAHNVKIGQSTAILASTIIGGSVIIGNGCQIGGNVSIKNNVTIGDRAKIVSHSAVLKDVGAGETVAGMPALDFALWKRQYAWSQLLYKQRDALGTALQELGPFARGSRLIGTLFTTLFSKIERLWKK